MKPLKSALHVVAVLWLVAAADSLRAQIPTPEERKAEQAAKSAEQDTQRIASATAYLAEALKQVSTVTGTLTRPDVKKSAQGSVRELVQNASREIRFVRDLERVREASITRTLTDMELRNPKLWDARKVKELIEKMIKQLNPPPPKPVPKPVPKAGSSTLPPAPPVLPPQPSADFFNLKKPSPQQR